MPYNLVITKNGSKDEVSAVPEGWVVGGTDLYWPRTLKKNEIESLRSNEKSQPEKSWKRMKCKVKLSSIASFKEALRLEELYSKFEDTEDEEMYLMQLNNKKKTSNILTQELLDLNFEFDKEVGKEVDKEVDKEVEDENKDCEINAEEDNNVVNFVVTDANENVQTIPSDTTNKPGEILSIPAAELLRIIQENNSLQSENKALKEELVNSVEFQNETKRNFAIMQTQLDKIFDLIQNEHRARNTSVAIANDKTNASDEDLDQIIVGNIKFPLETKEQLDALETKLFDQDVMCYLVKKFSETCGTSGYAKISKVGLPLMKRLINDELLNQFTWKGIKGTRKMAFVHYVKIRELFYKVARLADKSCSFSDSDSFIQNSAVKHSGQRIKRHNMSSESNKNAKKSKTVVLSENLPNESNHNENDTENLKSLTNEADNFTTPSKVTILSDIQIHNKENDIKDIKKMANISSSDVSAIFDNLINLSQ